MLKTARNLLKTSFKNRLSWGLMILGTCLVLLSLGPVLKSELIYYWWQLTSTTFKFTPDSKASDASVFGKLLNEFNAKPYSVFGALLQSSSKVVQLQPVDYNFSIIIEKLGVNAPVVPNVSVVNSREYKEALKRGVAHAFVSDLPSERPGNVYLFAHTSLNFWELGRYATTFNLLHKLSAGDTVYLVYKDRLFEYRVVGRTVVPGWDTRPLSRPTLEPILTLQTCSPPGTTLNRLIVTARLVSVQDL